MALVNTAVELAKRGHRVLMVDFDLEAPGLDTIKLARPRTQTPGVVDFISRYCQTATVPDVAQYVYKSPGESPELSNIWIMPAGLQDDNYDDRFKQIDWQALYKDKDGFLMFEDLKAQWENSIDPDYVLIDSCTGHTDIGGICTRQLPDAVVVLFFPNEQNRRGLEVIVDQIRDESVGPHGRVIELHFVVANVPDLDDEDEILATNMQRMQQSLKYSELSAVIHHYNSMALLDQAIFTLERPRSALAGEYRELTSAIVRKNLEDEDGAIDFLESALDGRRGRSISSADFESGLKDVKTKHSANPEILRRLAKIRKQQRKHEEAFALLNQGLAHAPQDPDMLLSRAELNAQRGETDLALLDLWEFFKLTSVPSFDLAIAVRLVRQLAPDFVSHLLASPALESADFDPELTRELEASPKTLELAERIIRRGLTNGAAEARNELILVLIGQGRFSDAEYELRQKWPNPDVMDIAGAFNSAMANWGTAGVPSPDRFSLVLRLSAEYDSAKDANFKQCMAIANWAVGDLEKAFTESQDSAAIIASSREDSFSAWSYLNVSPEVFLKELGEMEQMFRGQRQTPEFIVRAKSVLF